ncbi:TonB-dependent receptor [Flavobacterium sp.]|uniref:TonB-dependent receptor n=1 Tax=Flavobacterium sp. TaxID=239 RepID=UPI002BE2BE09|nr:TonB-dependent receptor [Flavobacterium sp.]HQA73598.1 TonB-dependent receptor plug domain-containing protein [Flavobacterium sp.]
MKKLLFITLLFISNSIYSQSVSGYIKDSFENPVDNAYIVNSSNNAHAHTDEIGSFKIDKTVLGDTLIVSALGFIKQRVVVNESTLKVFLQNTIYELEQVSIQPKLNAMNAISKIDLQTNPVNSSQEILRKVPGLFIGQHAGGGKAEQIFLRGFDIDHGTDIAISVDGMPVNMVSHAHGQGYADLHFLIPETVQKIDFGKGTYYASKGDFATAGYVAFQTKERTEKNAIGVEVGQFNTFRTLGMFNLIENSKTEDAFLATEYILTDGPFDAPQDFKRINLFGKYTKRFSNNSKLSIQASRFASNWNASGQIPQRLVDAGVISRFGAVDATEGGNTSRTNLNVSLLKPINENTFIKANAFYSQYNFELYSNFTFFLEDPINGDQIRQKEDRAIYGFNAEVSKKKDNAIYQFGLGFRSDETNDTELSHTKNRYETLEQLQLGDISQSNVFGYINADYTFGKFTVNPSVRVDYFTFGYNDKLATSYQNLSADKYKVSPKMNLIYSINNQFQVFAKSGLGFHSNDTRVVVAQEGKDILPTAFSTDLGTIFKPFPKMIINTALWYLQLDQEFVYVGDAGIVEPSGKTRRMGVELGIRYQLTDWLYFDTDANYTYGRSVDEPKGQDYIPLAPDFTTTGGLSFTKFKGFSGGFRYRYLKSRPANEDNSIVAKGYFVNDFNINYEYKNITFGIAIENLLNTKWNETQFATESRLQNETNSVEEIHFTPGTPFFIKTKVVYQF